MANEEVYEKLNDYTISATFDFERQAKADPELRRIFNFKARQVTHIFSQWYNIGIANSMKIENFSDLGSLEEVKLMREKLLEMGGHPPDIADLEQVQKPAIRQSGLNP